MLSKLGPHDHAVLVYHAADDRRAGLAAFTRRGLEADELIVFVHSFDSREEALAFVREADATIPALLDSQFFVLSFYKEAFEADAERIDFDHVVSVVDNLLAEARRQGRAGLGVYVDASHVYLGAGRADEWFQFEERLGRRLHHEMALVCAYPAESIRSPAMRERVLLTHQYRFGV